MCLALQRGAGGLHVLTCFLSADQEFALNLVLLCTILTRCESILEGKQPSNKPTHSFTHSLTPPHPQQVWGTMSTPPAMQCDLSCDFSVAPVYCHLRLSVKGELKYGSRLSSEGQILITSFPYGKDDKEMTCHFIPLECDSIPHSWQWNWSLCRPTVSFLYLHALYLWKAPGRHCHLCKNFGLDCTATWGRKATSVLNFWYSESKILSKEGHLQAISPTIYVLLLP